MRQALDEAGYTPETPLEHVVEWFPMDQMMAAPPQNVSFFHGYYSESDEYGCDDMRVCHEKGYSHVTSRYLAEFQLG